MGQEFQRYEAMLHLPYQIRKKNENGKSDPHPQPATPPQTPSCREHDRTTHAKREKSDERSPEEDQLQPPKQRRDGRIGYKTPIKMARIVEGLQLIAVESILAIRRDVEHHAPR